jgi:hypothetical protein
MTTSTALAIVSPHTDTVGWTAAHPEVEVYARHDELRPWHPAEG